MPRYDLNGNLVAADDPSTASSAQQYDPAGNAVPAPAPGQVVPPLPASDGHPP